MNLSIIHQASISPFTSDEAVSGTRRDLILCRAYLFTMNGWYTVVVNEFNDSCLQPYYRCRSDLNPVNGVITYGTRALIPGIYTRS